MGTVLLDEEPPTDAFAAQAPKKPGAAPAGKKGTTTGEFEALFSSGKGSEDDPAAKLEKKFWALLRIMERKGLVTKDEFAKELDDGEE